MDSFFNFIKEFPFLKIEATGNDYIYFDFTTKNFHPNIINTQTIPLICDRRYGIGSDGIVVIANGKEYVRMYMWNSDGSYSKMCGNALRSIAFYWYKKTNQKEFFVETEVGIHQAIILKDSGYRGNVKIQMGMPKFEPVEIPFKGSERSNQVYQFYDPNILPYRGYVVSMGNPHCVFIVDDPDKISLEVIGPKIENHFLFPERTNVEFIKINSDGSIYQRTWERGAGETLACGSGACAVHVVSVLEKKLPTKNTIHLRGGDVILEWDRDVWLTGNVSMLYLGSLTDDLFKNLFNINL